MCILFSNQRSILRGEEMNFVISDIVTFNKNYAKDNHMYLPLHSIEDLEGFPRIGIRIHEFDALTTEQEDLQKQVEALAFFGYVYIVYVDDEGNENVFYKRAESLLSNGNAQKTTIETTQYTEQQIQDLLDSEGEGCSSGACAI
ncbi:hypothetical protein N9459_04285 [Flavobacteriaceae bacterium]|nr:hypothetical protein [Flavobacteriaceae bacterium]